MRNHQEQKHDHQEVMVPMASQENLNLETALNHHHHNNNHHHLMVPVDSQKRSDLETTHNHHLVMDSHENPNLETTRNHRHHVPPSPSSSSQDSKRTHHQHMSHAVKKTHVDERFISENACDQVIKKSYDDSCSSLEAGGDMMTTPPPPPQEESGRERLKRHRVEMAGRVWIPDIWGHEDLLKDWIDCTVFDSSLGNNNIMSARAALVQEGRSTLRIENRC